MKNAFDRLISRHDMVEKEFELYTFSIATSETEKQAKTKTTLKISKNCGTTTNTGNIREKGTEADPKDNPINLEPDRIRYLLPKISL